MAFTCQDVADLARTWMNDDAKDRNPDAKVEKWVNSGLQMMALLRPDLFVSIGSFVTVGTTPWQDIRTSFPDALVLLDVLGPNANGGVITECELYPLQASKPGAFIATPGAPVNWCRDPQMKRPQSGTRFLLDPPATAGAQITVMYAGSPAYVLLAQAIPLPEAYKAPLAQYVVHASESVDDEYITSGRAMQALSGFMGPLNQGEQDKQIEANK